VLAGAACLAPSAHATTVTLNAQVSEDLDLVSLSAPIAFGPATVRVPFFWEREGRPVRLYGRVLDDADDPPARPAAVSVRAYGYPFAADGHFRQVRLVHTSRDGSFSLTLPTPANNTYYAAVVRAFQNTFGGISSSFSSPLAVLVAPGVSVRTTKLDRTRVRLVGQVPAASRLAARRGLFTLEETTAGAARSLGTLRTGADGSFARVVETGDTKPGTFLHEYRLLYVPSDPAEYVPAERTFTVTVTIPRPKLIPEQPAPEQSAPQKPAPEPTISQVSSTPVSDPVTPPSSVQKVSQVLGKLPPPPV
jgi:hypothetical protein